MNKYIFYLKNPLIAYAIIKNLLFHKYKFIKRSYKSIRRSIKDTIKKIHILIFQRKIKLYLRKIILLYFFLNPVSKLNTSKRLKKLFNLILFIESINFKKNYTLHFVNKSFLLHHINHGSKKDIITFEKSLTKNNVDLITIYINRAYLLFVFLFLWKFKRKLIQNSEYIIVDLTGATHKIFIYLRFFFKISRDRMIWRVHNADFPHRLDVFKIERNFFRKITLFYVSIKLLISNYISAKFSKLILSPSRYDIYFYWKKLNKNSFYYPYTPLKAKKIKLSNRPEKLIITSLGSPHHGNITIDQELNFYKLIAKIPRNLNLFFIQTFFQKKFSNRKLIQSPGFTFVEEIYSITDIFCVLSNLGRGTKTKILDAQQYGKTAIIPKLLYNRMDVENLQNIFFLKDHNKEEFGEITKNDLNTLKKSINNLNNVYPNNYYDFQHNQYFNQRKLVTSNFYNLIYQKASVKFEKTAVLFVLYNNPEYLIHNINMIIKKNYEHDLDFYIVLNRNYEKSKSLKDFLLKKLILKDGNNYFFYSFNDNYYHSSDAGSKHHASGLHLGLQLIYSKKIYSNLAILDPDFFIIKKNWIDFFLKEKKKRFSSVWSPEFIGHDLNTPCVHFMFIKDCNKHIPHLDFTPDREINIDIKEKFKANTFLKSRANTFFKRLKVHLILNKLDGSNCDTGYRNTKYFKKYSFVRLDFSAAPKNKFFKVEKKLTIRRTERLFFRIFFKKIYSRFLYMQKSTERYDEIRKKLFNIKFFRVNLKNLEFHHFKRKLIGIHLRTTNNKLDTTMNIKLLNGVINNLN